MIAGADRVGFRSVLRVAEFRWLWIAGIASVLGDQLARVAVAVLVFNQTSSAALTAAVYALTFLPAIFGSLLFGGIADRWPRRTVLVGGDLVRGVLLAVMALPGLPLAVLAALIVAVVLVSAPWEAADSALLADVLNPSQYPIGIGLRASASQAAQIGGFAVGGLVVALIGARGALYLDAVTFLFSAVLLRYGLRLRPAARDSPPQQPGAAAGAVRWWTQTWQVLGPAPLRNLLGFSWLLGLLVIPEGLAVPYAGQLHEGAQAVGVLLTAGPVGVLMGTVLFTRFLNPRARHRLLAPLAAVAGAPLLLCLLHPGLWLSAVLFAVSGVCTAYQVQVVAEFLVLVPDHVRGRAFGVASSGLLAAQGVGLLAGGVLAGLSSPTTAIATAGATAMVLAGTLSVSRFHLDRVAVPAATSAAGP